MTSCEECGWTYGDTDVRAHAERFVDAFDGAPTRPAPDAWSHLEYGCHVRDVLRIQVGRVAAALVEDTPSFTPMGRDERPRLYRYDAQLPDVVAREILDAADSLGRVIDAMGPEHLERTVTYSWPEPRVHTLEWVAQHTVHELVHHRLDITR